MTLLATVHPAYAVNALVGQRQAVERRLSPAIDLQRLIRDAVMIVSLLAVNAAGIPGAVLFFTILIIMVVKSPETAFKAIAICCLGLMINTYFVPKTLIWTPGRLVIPYLALVRFSIDMIRLRRSVFGYPPYVAFLFFVCTMSVCSVASGWYTHIAILKLVNYLAFMTMIISGATVLRARRSDVGEWFVSIILAATLFGIGSLAFGVSSNFFGPKTGLTRGFNGAFLHPNIHATYATLFIAFLASVGIISRYRHTWIALPMIGCWELFIAWCSSRTAAVASLLPVLLLLVYARPLRDRLGWRLKVNVSRSSLVGILLFFAGIVLAIDVFTESSVSKSLVMFINKTSSPDGPLSTEQIVSSRRNLVLFSWQNFVENPVFGIGFGVAKTKDFERMATIFTAPAEKGFLPTAILEEGGLLGTLAFVTFICTFAWQLIRESNVAGIVCFLTFLGTNVGEATIMSPGGGGAFGWVMVAAAMVFGDRCWTPPHACAPAGRVCLPSPV